ncbi:MAG: thioredoxin family protein [Luteolibacter sp.]
MRFKYSCAVVALASALTSCASKKPETDEKPFGPTGVPDIMRPKNSDIQGTPVIPGGNQPQQQAALPKNMTPEEDIVFTDPDNPDAKIPELSAVLDAPKVKAWEESEAIAKRRATREGKPILIWFTDSARSPLCKALSEELFSTNEFDKWAADNVVRLRVDANVRQPDSDLSLADSNTAESNRRAYVQELNKRYKILGYPGLIMVDPSGAVVARFRGYKRGEGNYVWGQIKHNQGVVAERYRSWREGLEKKGYREWQDRKGRKVFAKLKSYANGQLVLVEPDGTVSRAKESVFSDQDQDWIKEQKKMRGIQ